MLVLKTFKLIHTYFCMSDFWTALVRCTSVYKIVYQHLTKQYRFRVFSCLYW